MVVACGKQKVQRQKNYENFAIVVHIPQTTQYLVIFLCEKRANKLID